jgi:hypothetical protein
MKAVDSRATYTSDGLAQSSRPQSQRDSDSDSYFHDAGDDSDSDEVVR